MGTTEKKAKHDNNTTRIKFNQFDDFNQFSQQKLIELIEIIELIDFDCEKSTET